MKPHLVLSYKRGLNGWTWYISAYKSRKATEGLPFAWGRGPTVRRALEMLRVDYFSRLRFWECFDWNPYERYKWAVNQTIPKGWQTKSCD